MRSVCSGALAPDASELRREVDGAEEVDAAVIDCAEQLIGSASVE